MRHPGIRVETLFAAALAGVLALVLGLSFGARAQNVFERLVMPGPLSRGHEKLEKKCEACHEPFTRASQMKLCLDCHKPIGEDRARQTGFHGRSADARAGECRQCHGEHQGREADIVGLDRQLFNHQLTDFTLNGVHRLISCGACHETGKKHREAAHTCHGCHKGNDAHKGRLGTDCGKCHTEQTWRPAKPFDHAKTKFPLQGAHQSVGCRTCHAGEVYADMGTGCASCHAINDNHQGRFGPKCETCHKQTQWKGADFKHDVVTRFPLRGAHAAVKCDGCHKSDGVQRDKPPMTCVSCHLHQEPHKGQLGTRCETCHNEQSWRAKVAFDHDITRFPLVGHHKQVACAACHKTKAYKDTPRACASCHADKVHNGRFGSECAKCHVATAWRNWQFDHDRQTRFALTGAHKAQRCHSCHTAERIPASAVPSSCHACHAKDDVHRGSFGQVCEQCHSTTSFKQRIMRR